MLSFNCPEIGQTKVEVFDMEKVTFKIFYKRLDEPDMEFSIELVDNDASYIVRKCKEFFTGNYELIRIEVVL